MLLSEKQQHFSIAISKLILYANSIGVGLTYGDAYAGGKYGHMKNSNHYLRLAVDLNLWVDGKYITSSEHYIWKELHDYFEMHLGGAKAISNDMNHFSFEHKGRR